MIRFLLLLLVVTAGYAADKLPLVIDASNRPVQMPAGDRLRLPIAGPFYTALAPSATADRVLTLPDATTTLAGLSVAQTFTALQIMPASASGGAGFASIRLPHGAAPDTNITNGDVWTTTSGVFARINGATVGPLGTGTPAGANTYVQFNDSGALGGVAAFTFTKTTGAENLQVLQTTDAGNTFGLSTAFFRATRAPTSGNGSQIGVRGQADFTGAGFAACSSEGIGGSFTATTANTAVTTMIMKGVSGTAQKTSTGTTGALYGGIFSASNSSGTVTDMYGIYVSTANSGTVTNRYGIYQDDAAATNVFTGTVAIANGSVGSPSVALASDPDTGMWSAGAATLNWSLGGAERLSLYEHAGGHTILQGLNLRFNGNNGSQTVPTFASGGDVDTGDYLISAGIWGTTTAGTLRLSVSTTAVTSTLPVTISDATASTSTSTGSFINAGGAGIAGAANIGGSITGSTTFKVGATSLDADFTSEFGTPYASSIGNGNSAYHFVALSNVNSSSGATYIGSHTRSTGTDANTIVQSGDALLIINAYGADGAAYRSAGYMAFSVDGTPGASDMPGRWQLFLTPDGSATPALALTIDNTKLATFAGGITHGSATLLTTTVGLTDGAAAAAGTLLNAPAAGNPTKWIPINDNGTTRYIPAW